MRGIQGLGEEQLAANIMLPPPMTSDTVASRLNPSASTPGIAFNVGNKAWTAPAGAAQPPMTGPAAPAPYTVVGRQPGASVVANSDVAEWSTAAWGAFGNGRAYSEYYSDGYQPAGTPAARKEQVAAGTGELKEPRRIVIGVGAGGKKFVRYRINIAFAGREPRAWKVFGGPTAAGPWTLLDTRGVFASQAAAGFVAGSPTEFLLDGAATATFAFYMIEFTHVAPMVSGSGNTSWIDLLELRFYEGAASYVFSGVPMVCPAVPTRGMLTVRVGGLNNIILGADIQAQLSRDGAVFADVPLTIAGKLADGTFLLSGEASFETQAAVAQVIGRLNVLNGSLSIYGWAFGPLAT